MRRYELMLLLRPDLEDDKLQAAVEKVTRAIVNGGGSLSKVSPWGKRRLAYPIHHLREASYFLIHFDIEPGAVREIERGMLISEEILRHLVTVLEDRGPAPEEPEPAVPERSEESSTEDGTTEASKAPPTDASEDASEQMDQVSEADEPAAAEEPEPEAEPEAAEEPEATKEPEPAASES